MIEPRAEEADARHHLGGDARRVEGHVLHPNRVLEPVGRHDHQQAGADADQHVGADACRPHQPLALEADQAAEQRRHGEAQRDVEVGDHGDQASAIAAPPPAAPGRDRTRAWPGAGRGLRLDAPRPKDRTVPRAAAESRHARPRPRSRPARHAARARGRSARLLRRAARLVRAGQARKPCGPAADAGSSAVPSRSISASRKASPRPARPIPPSGSTTSPAWRHGWSGRATLPAPMSRSTAATGCSSTTRSATASS